MRVLTVLASAFVVAGLLVARTEAGARQGSAQNAKTEVRTLSVSGMTCGGCATAVRMAAMKVAGVSDAKVSYEKGVAIIRYDPVKTNPEAIAKTITEKTGFKTAVQKHDSRR